MTKLKQKEISKGIEKISLADVLIDTIIGREGDNNTNPFAREKITKRLNLVFDSDMTEDEAMNLLYSAYSGTGMTTSDGERWTLEPLENDIFRYRTCPWDYPLS